MSTNDRFAIDVLIGSLQHSPPGKFDDLLEMNPEAIAEALAAVIKRHSPRIAYVTDAACDDWLCSHEYECPTETFTYCAGCDVLAESVDNNYADENIEVTAYPCPDILAISEALSESGGNVAEKGS